MENESQQHIQPRTVSQIEANIGTICADHSHNPRNAQGAIRSVR